MEPYANNEDAERLWNEARHLFFEEGFSVDDAFREAERRIREIDEARQEMETWEPEA